MRRRLLLALGLLALAVALGLYSGSDTGYVVLGRGPWVVETSMTVFVVLLAAVFAVLYVLVRVTARLSASPRRIGAWFSGRRKRRANALLAQGMSALAEGRWAAAEKLLLRSAAGGDSPLLAYAGAARAAQGQNASARRDEHLRRAHACVPEARSAAPGASDPGPGESPVSPRLEPESRVQAMSALAELQHGAADHAYLGQLLPRLFAELGEWQSLLDLLPALRRRKVISADRADTLEAQAWAGLLERAAGGGAGELEECWGRVPRERRRDEEVLGVFVRELVAGGENDRAEALLRDAIEHGWSARLVHLYGLCEAADASRQLARAESWRNRHRDDPVLLLTLGRLFARNRLWGKAREALERSIARDPNPETYRVLAELLERLDDRAGAAVCARRGLAVAARRAGFYAASNRGPDREPDPAPAGAADPAVPAAGAAGRTNT